MIGGHVGLRHLRRVLFGDGINFDSVPPATAGDHCGQQQGQPVPVRKVQ